MKPGLAIMHPHTANYFMHGKPPALTGNEHPNLVPYAVFPARDGNVFMGVGNDGTFRKLMKELGRPELGTDSRLHATATASPIAMNLTAILIDILKDHDSEPLCRRLLAAGLPAGPVQSIDKALQRAHQASRRCDRKDWYKGVASPIRFDRTKASLRHVPPKFGEHSDAILGEFGYSAKEIAGTAREWRRGGRAQALTRNAAAQSRYLAASAWSASPSLVGVGYNASCTRKAERL